MEKWTPPQKTVQNNYTLKKLFCKRYFAKILRQSIEWKKEQRNEHFVLFANNGFTDELIELAKSRNNVMLCE